MKVLLVDASPNDLRTISALLIKAKFDPLSSDNMDAAKKEVKNLPPHAVIVTGVKFRGGTATELIHWLKSGGFNYPVIVIVDKMEAMLVHEVMKNHGAVEVVQRPALDLQLVDAVSRHSHPCADACQHTIFPRPSKISKGIMESIRRVASTKANVIIFGESGTGKEIIARKICELSSRKSLPVIVLEAGGAALVGKYDPTSGNSKMYDRIRGYFNQAAGGTIIIKNIQLLSFDKQSILLHILTNEWHDVRVICTASSDLLKMVEHGEFRDSLFYQLRHSDIMVPPLRETIDDIPTIAEYILEEYAKESANSPKHLDASARKALKSHLWPGNVRELKYLLKLSAYNTQGNLLTSGDLLFTQSDPEPSNNLRLNDPKTEKQLIVHALKRTNGIISQAAKLLGIARSTLSYKIKQHGLKENNKQSDR